MEKSLALFKKYIFLIRTRYFRSFSTIIVTKYTKFYWTPSVFPLFWWLWDPWALHTLHIPLYILHYK